MSTVVTAGVLVAGIVGLELALRSAVRRARRSFQWLIVEADEVPTLDQERLSSFLAGSFSSELGWEPVPGSTGVDRTHGVESRFTIDDVGARAAPADAPAPTAAAFGDSYAFCRQVDDDQTWAAVVGRLSGVGVVNLGVGNYGVDQALLRYLQRRDRLPDTVSTILVVFVPETIARIRSVWKHWMEFGNTFGFKPRFMLRDGELVLYPNPVRGAEDFARLAEVAGRLAAIDPFHRSRFRRLQFRGSYLLSFLRAPIRHATILATVLSGRSGSGSDELTPRAFERAFTRVMRDNVRESHRLYVDAEATELLTSVLMRFRSEVEADGRRFVACVIPQLLDLRRPRRADRTYRAYFAGLADRLEILDLTPALRGHAARDLYVHDRYGGHLSALGNRVVAEALVGTLAAHMSVDTDEP